MHISSTSPEAPTVSIVTPSYNQGAFIEETIRSVLCQSGDFFLDYIIVDGGSTDQTLGIIRKYDQLITENRIPVSCRGLRFRWLSEKDRGQSDAIAKGMALAQGDLLAWLNSDDYYVGNAIGRAVQLYHENRDISLVYGHSQYVDERGNHIGSYPVEPFNRERLATTNFICQPSTFFSRAAYDRCGGVDIGLHYTMDYDLWIRMALHGELRYLPELLSCYRLHATSKTVSLTHALENHRECLATVYRHYHWAPINRVAGYCFRLVQKRLPAFLSRVPMASLPLTILMSIPYYLRLNKGFRLADLRMVSQNNVRTLWNMTREGAHAQDHSLPTPLS